MKDNSWVNTKDEILPAPPESGVSELLEQIVCACQDAGGWLPFDRFMALALYAPGLGYYANGLVKFGALPTSGSDFVTAPELSPWFGRTLGRQVAQALKATKTDEVWEFGAGSGALADQVLSWLGSEGISLRRYTIVDVSGVLRDRQQRRLHPWGDLVQWASSLPPQMQGVVLGNEVLDAMPVKLLRRLNGSWHERGVVVHESPDGRSVLAWEDRPTTLRPPVEVPGSHDYQTEIHPQAEAFVRTLADRWHQGAGFLIDYGFPESEFYHPQRHMGTLMCHRQHLSDPDPLSEVGLKDITSHVNFTGVALAAQEAGLQIMGYTSQGRFLLNAGLLELAGQAGMAERSGLLPLVNEHEMGELFKVLALAPVSSAEGWLPIGFVQGDRTHTL
jgi:SAM-dependent MidA family methyltransferase